MSDDADVTCAYLAQALNNVNPAAVLRPSGTVVSIKCVEKIIKKDMLDPFTGELGKIAQGTMTEGVAKASSVIVLCSKDYKFSPAARTEAMHAKTLGKHVSAPLPPAWICRSS